MDPALWITWYDLPADGREAYLSWLHGKYIPWILKRPGFLYAGHYLSANVRNTKRVRHTDDPAVATGNTYILIFGGESAHALGNPARSRLHAELPPEDQKMLAMRIGERVSMFIDIARVDGPAANQREGEMALGPAIQMGSFVSGTADEEEITEFYVQWRMPAMAKMPGCLRFRRLISVAGWARHGCLYEFVSVAALRDGFASHETTDPKMTAWTDELIPKFRHAPGTPVVAQRIWPPVK